MTHAPGIVSLLLAAAAAAACAPSPVYEADGGAPVVCEWQGAGRPEELSSLGCPADHDALAGEPKAAALPANRGVMFLVERNKDNAVHFFDTQRWRHFLFATERLEGYPDFTAFNSEMYYRPDRRLFLATLTRYLGPDLYALEIAPIDKAPPELIAEMFHLVAAHLGWPADLRYHPTSNALEMAERLPPGVPVVTTEELYEGATYQGLNLGRTIGRVRLLTVDALPGEYVSRMEIAVLDSVPNDISAVAGLVTGEFQTPLSHVNLLSQNRGTPNMALKGALDDPRFEGNAGKWVELEVRADGFSVTPSTAEAAEAFWAAKRPVVVQYPDLDTDFTDLVDIEDVDVTWTPRVGGKAANFGEMAHIEPALPLPDAFAVPCAHYITFMEDNGLAAEVSALLDDPRFQEDGIYRMEKLAALRDAIRAAPVDAALVSAVEDKIAADYGAIPIRFRSSSNAEDLEGFNGAGLYDSYSAKPGDPSATVEGTLKKVWASLWNIAAFEERDWARVDHLSCAMGILAHPSFPDEIEAANGVAITANPFDPPPDGQAAYYVNVQDGAVSVANPSPGITPEAFLYYKPPAGQGEMTYLSSSSLTDGEKVLAFDEIVELVKNLKAIHDHFGRIYTDRPAFGMDVEFKLVLPDRKLFIKQARPYPFADPW